MIRTKIEKKNERKVAALLPTGQTWKSIGNLGDGMWETGAGKEAADSIVSAIQDAKSMICVASFIMDTNPIVDALRVAAGRGVKVYVLGSAEAKLQDEIEDVENEHRTQYERLLKETFVYRFLFRSADFFHAKFVLIDPMSAPQGFLCTCNLTSKALFENPELVIALDEDQVQSLYRMFVYHFWEHSTQEHGPRANFEAVRPLSKFLPPDMGSVIQCSPERTVSNLKAKLKAAILRAKSEIVISTFSLDADFELVQLIREKLANGVSVVLFTRKLPRQVPLLFELARFGALIYVHPLIHAKFLEVDGESGFVFTANFKSQGMDSGWEVGIELHPSQLTAMSILVERWKSNFPLFLKREHEISKHAGKIQVIEHGRLIDKTVKEVEVNTRKIAQPRLMRNLREEWTSIEKLEVPEFAQKLEIMVEIALAKFGHKEEGRDVISPQAALVRYESGPTEKGKKQVRVSRQAVIVSHEIRVDELLDLCGRYADLEIFQAG